MDSLKEKTPGVRFLRRIILLSFLAFGLFSVSEANAASLYFRPSSGTYGTDQSFTVSAYVESADQAMNAASGVISFPIGKLQVVGISKAGSIFNLWVQEPSFSNSEGRVNFEGVVLNPGFTGQEGKIISVTFRPRSVGAAQLSFASGAVLANDGEGTNILESLGEARYQISTGEGGKSGGLLPVIRSSTHPDPSQWYNLTRAEFSWDLPDGVDAVGYALNSEPNFASPPRQGLLSKAPFDLGDYNEGVLYFHVRFYTKEGWGPIAHRQARVDYSPPSPPEILRKLGDDESTNPQPQFSFKSTDTFSGVASYSIKLENAWIDTITLADGYYALPLQTPGEHFLTVRAYDNAGNFSESTSTFVVHPIEAPRIITYSEKLDSPREALVVEGESLPGVTLNLFLRKADKPINFSTVSDSAGKWTARYEERVPAGTWSLSAQAKDARGALSEESQKVEIEVKSRGSLFLFLSDWWLFLVFALLLIVLLVYVLHRLLRRAEKSRTGFKKRLSKFRAELTKELRHLEDESEGMHRGAREIDLSPGRLREKEGRLKKEIGHLQEDIQKEIKEIDELDD